VKLKKISEATVSWVSGYGNWLLCWFDCWPQAGFYVQK